MKNGNVIREHLIAHIRMNKLLEFDWCELLTGRLEKELVVHILMSLWCVIKIT